MQKTDDGKFAMGSGYLFAIEADNFARENFDIDEMVEIGYIQDSAKFKHTQEVKEVNTANYGTVKVLGGQATSTFETGIISYNVENVARFLTGNSVTTNNGKKITYGTTKYQRPEVALVFASDKSDADYFLVMPKCVWVGDYELDFNNDNPVAFNYNFRCLDVTMPNGEIGSYWEITSDDTEETTSETNPATTETQANP